MHVCLNVFLNVYDVYIYDKYKKRKYKCMHLFMGIYKWICAYLYSHLVICVNMYVFISVCIYKYISYSNRLVICSSIMVTKCIRALGNSTSKHYNQIKRK